MKLRATATLVALIVLGVYLANPFNAPTWSPIGRLAGQQFYRMPNAAMEPAIGQGETFRACFGIEPAAVGVGDVVLFYVPDIPDIIQVKRVAGLGDSTVEIEDSVVLVDGSPVGSWFHSEQTARQYSREMAALRLPAGSAFVLGDNLDRSRDSRVYGPLPIESIVGRRCN